MSKIKNNVCSGCEKGDCDRETHADRCKYAKKEQTLLNKKIRQQKAGGLDE